MYVFVQMFGQFELHSYSEFILLAKFSVDSKVFLTITVSS